MRNHVESQLPTKRFFVRAILGRTQVAEIREREGPKFNVVLDQMYRGYRQNCSQAQSAVATMDDNANLYNDGIQAGGGTP